MQFRQNASRPIRATVLIVLILCRSCVCSVTDRPTRLIHSSLFIKLAESWSSSRIVTSAEEVIHFPILCVSVSDSRVRRPGVSGGSGSCMERLATSNNITDSLLQFRRQIKARLLS